MREMDLSVFDVPHLKDKVTQQLALHDLTQCVLVSRDWHAWFSPTLWRNVNFNVHFNRKLAALKARALDRYRDHARSIVGFDKYLLLAPATMETFPNLRSFECTTQLATFHEIKLLRFIAATSSLQSVKMTLVTPSTRVLDLLLDTVERHPSLSKLDLTWPCFAYLDETQKLVATCSRRRQMQSLRLNFRSTQRLDWRVSFNRLSCSTRNDDTDMEGLIDETPIKELSIQASSPDQEHPLLLPLLRRAVQLERLDLDWMRCSRSLEHIVQVFERRTHTRLKHLYIGDIVKDMERIPRLLQAVGYSQRDNSDDDMTEATGYLTGQDDGGLETLSVHQSIPFDRRCVLPLIRHHADTLTFLDLSHGGDSSRHFGTFASVVGGLPNLRSLSVSLWLGLWGTMATELDRALRTSWACLGLRILVLTLDLPQSSLNNLDDIDGFAGPTRPGSLEDKIASNVFAQINDLHQLEEWKLMSQHNPLTLTGGYLDRIPDLKSLRSLDIRKFRTGIMETEWMLDHWTNLAHIVMCNGGIRRWRIESDGSSFHIIKSVLLGRRPWMQVDEDISFTTCSRDMQ